MIDTDELDRLQAASGSGEQLEVVVSACAYCCCGRGWVRRDGYEQRYRGSVGNLTADSFVLTAPGIGTISYLVYVRLDDVAVIEA